MLTARWNNLFPPRLLTQRVTCQLVWRRTILSVPRPNGTDNQAESGALECLRGLAGNCFMVILNMKTISNKSKSQAVPEGRKGCGAEAFISAGTRNNKRISFSSDMHRLTECFQSHRHDVSRAMLSMFVMSAFNILKSII